MEVKNTLLLISLILAIILSAVFNAFNEGCGGKG